MVNFIDTILLKLEHVLGNPCSHLYMLAAEKRESLLVKQKPENIILQWSLIHVSSLWDSNAKTISMLPLTTLSEDISVTKNITLLIFFTDIGDRWNCVLKKVEVCGTCPTLRFYPPKIANFKFRPSLKAHRFKTEVPRQLQFARLSHKIV